MKNNLFRLQPGLVLQIKTLNCFSFIAWLWEYC